MSLPQPPPILWRSSRCLLSPVHRLSSSYLSVALSFRLSIFDLHEFIFGHWNLSKASYFCLSLFCHCVFMSQFSQFILVHQNLSGSLLSPFYCLFVFLSYCLYVTVPFSHCVFMSMCLSVIVSFYHCVFLYQFVQFILKPSQLIVIRLEAY